MVIPGSLPPHPQRAVAARLVAGNSRQSGAVRVDEVYVAFSSDRTAERDPPVRRPSVERALAVLPDPGMAGSISADNVDRQQGTESVRERDVPTIGRPRREIIAVDVL